MGDYRVVSLKGNQVEVQPAIGGPTEMKHIKHVKYILLQINILNNCQIVLNGFSITGYLIFTERQAFAHYCELPQV